MVILSILLSAILIIAFLLYTKPTLMEKQIKSNGGNFPCFKCKKEIHMSMNKCPSCDLITYFGITRKKQKKFFLVIIVYVFGMVNIWRKNIAFF